MDTMSLVITETNNILEQVIKETETRSENLLKSLEEFQVLTNEALTKLIQNSDLSALCDKEDSTDVDSDSEEETQEDQQLNPKKRKI